jgi:hypothetical protein
MPQEGGGPTPLRSVARTGSLTLSVPEVVSAAAELRRLAEAIGGFVASENIATAETKVTSTSRIVLSIPADRLDAFLDDAAKVGVLQHRGVTARDVTDQVVDVEARIRTLRESIARIRALLGRAGSVTEIAQVEGELTRRQSDLESLLAQQQALKNQVERAPVTVTLLKPGQVEPQNPFLAGLLEGWEALQRSITVLLTVVGAILPFAVLIALVGWPILLRMRRRAAASAKTAAPRAESNPPEANPEA